MLGFTLTVRERVAEFERPWVVAVKVCEFMTKDQRQGIRTVRNGKPLHQVEKPLFDEHAMLFWRKHGDVEDGRFSAHHAEFRRCAAVTDRTDQAPVDVFGPFKLRIISRKQFVSDRWGTRKDQPSGVDEAQ